MKKISILMGALALAGGFASCSDDDTPALNTPESFVLNTPPMADQYYELTPGGTIALSCSQPEYGFVAAATYGVEMSLDKSEDNVYAIESNAPSQAAFTISQDAVAMGFCKLNGIETADQWNELNPGYAPVYLRATAQLNKGGVGLVKSNWIELKNVKPYFAVPAPGFIYLIGTPSEWSMNLTETLKEWRLYEDDKAIGSKIYTGVFNIPAGDVLFRFYTELDGNWDTFSYGPANNHNGDAVASDGAFNITCEFNADGEFTDGIKATKDNFHFPNWDGGQVTIIVDMSKEDAMTVTMVRGEHKPVVTNYAYMVGNNGGWVAPDAESVYATDWRLTDEDATGIYTGTFQMPADFGNDGDKLYCRFYDALAGWGAAKWSAAADGSNVDAFSGIALPTVTGEGCFVLAGAAGHSVTVNLDANNNEVTFTIND